MKAIIYLQDSGVVAVIHPVDKDLSHEDLDVLAKRDVPTGKAYKIIDVADLPQDRSERMAWTVDEADLNDGVGA